MFRIFMLICLALPLLACSNESVAEKETEPTVIKVASVPSGATVRMQGAKIGETPLDVSVRQTTPVEIELSGYKPARLFVDPAGKMNLVAELEQRAEAKTPAARKISPTSITELKKQYRAGEIDKIEYKRLVTKLKNKMKTEINQLKASYKRGDIDKIEYKRRVQKIKYRYKG